jgi:hypothetical protein
MELNFANVKAMLGTSPCQIPPSHPPFKSSDKYPRKDPAQSPLSRRTAYC